MQLEQQRLYKEQKAITTKTTTVPAIAIPGPKAITTTTAKATTTTTAATGKSQVTTRHDTIFCFSLITEEAKKPFEIFRKSRI